MNWVNNLSRKTLAWGSLVFAILILFCVNIIAGLGLGNAKVDLTEQRLFTISPGTKAVLQTIDEPLQVKVYYSKPLGRSISLKLIGVMKRRSPRKLSEPAEPR